MGAGSHVRAKNASHSAEEACKVLDGRRPRRRALATTGGPGGEKWVSLRAAETVAACEQGLSSTSGVPASASRTDDLALVDPLGLRIRADPVHPCDRARACAAAEAGGSMTLQAGAATTLGRLLAMQGDFEQARELFVFGQDFYRSAGYGCQRCGRNAPRGVDRASRGRSCGRGGAPSAGASRSFAPLVIRRSSPPWPSASLTSSTCRVASTKPRDMCTVVREASPADDLINFVFADAIEGCLLSTGRVGHEEAEASIIRRGRRRCRDDSTSSSHGPTCGSSTPRRCPLRMRQRRRRVRQRSLSGSSTRRATSRALLVLGSASMRSRLAEPPTP